MSIWRPENSEHASVVIGGQVFRAVLFDMDGVVTDTRQTHRAAWGCLFHELSESGGVGNVELDDESYREFIDGKERNAGLRSYLNSRNIELPLGTPDDLVGSATVENLLERKNRFFLAELEREGVGVIAPTVRWIRQLRAAGVRTALVSASKNAPRVLEAACLSSCFDIRLDGGDIALLGLDGKPSPDTYREAARRLAIPPAECVVVEDSIAGIRAARSGGFGLPIGLGSSEHLRALTENGAELAVTDIGEIDFRFVRPTAREGDNHDPGCRLCGVGNETDSTLEYRGVDPSATGLRETMSTVGNGFFATRGALSECHDDGIHYPGTYVAGCYNRLTSDVDGHSREDESMVNLPDWTTIVVTGPDGERLDEKSTLVTHHHESLDLAHGICSRESVFSDTRGRVTRIRQRRIVSMDDPHLAAITMTVAAENWEGTIDVTSGITTNVVNNNVPDYSTLAGNHLDIVSLDTIDDQCISATVQTTRSHIQVTQAERLRLVDSEEAVTQRNRRVSTDHSGIMQVVRCRISRDQPANVEKTSALFTSRDRSTLDPKSAAWQRVREAETHEILFRRHCSAWDRVWHRFAITLAARDSTALATNVSLLHVLQTLSTHTTDLDVGVPARGLHGEAYRGHVFWDELFVVPILTRRLPELTSSLLLYRCRRLSQARRNARGLNLAGALFPWQSGSDGREETPTFLFNPRSDHWMPDHSRRQQHVNLAIAHNVWHYWQMTTDLEFLAHHGVDLLIENARFWMAKSEYDASSDRYDIRGVMGPDEFHDGYPDRPGAGIDNNAYVNVMTEWSLMRAVDAVRVLRNDNRYFPGRIDVSEEELTSWDRMSRRLRLTFLDNGLISQFEGFGALTELDWADYRSRYGDIGRLDLILEAEGDSPIHYKASKQADILMLLYVFTAEELTELITRLGYEFDPSVIPEMIDYYLERTTHGSTLSRISHTWVLVRGNRSHSWAMLRDALAADLSDAQRGSTREGIHLGAMAGAIDILERCYTGLDFRDNTLWLHPQLPLELDELAFTIYYRGHRLRIQCTHSDVTVTSETKDVPPIELSIHATSYTLAASSSVNVASTSRAASDTDEV
ncbi:HAD-IA family hydrolase [Rhodococcus sp. D-46]|uniref:HAD-IA family hydrolase n=1 Tax=Rhodococcus TaxID=1827 RepID=UPI0013F5C1DD|nr:HAD-IA family hydrolase [Rhodococcus sp. (in: high G+C Gram-positive bacteria)]MBQ9057056.1 HAD-IA family hydrolase [Rhodococcus sp. (in: high G+C Gram-positive bacteria)]NHE67548.1 HAD-IA family hydrolase [Rhodococcus sp. D-46]